MNWFPFISRVNRRIQQPTSGGWSSRMDFFTVTVKIIIFAMEHGWIDFLLLIIFIIYGLLIEFKECGNCSNYGHLIATTERVQWILFVFFFFHSSTEKKKSKYSWVTSSSSHIIIFKIIMLHLRVGNYMMIF